MSVTFVTNRQPIIITPARVPDSVTTSADGAGLDGAQVELLTNSALDKLGVSPAGIAPALQAPIQALSIDESVSELQGIVGSGINHTDVARASLDRHLPPAASVDVRGGPSDSLVAASDAIVSDPSFALLVTLMRTMMQLARTERDEKDAANQMRMDQVKRAGDEGIAAANSNFAGAVAGFAVGAAVGAAALARTVQSSNLTTKGVSEKVIGEGEVDLGMPGTRASTSFDTAKAAEQDEPLYETIDDEEATQAFEAISQQQPGLSDVGAESAAHLANGAQAQKLFAQGQLANMLVAPTVGMITSIGQLDASSHEATRLMDQADADLSQQRASERGEQVTQDHQRQDSAMQVLDTLLRNNVAAADQIVGHM